LGSARDNAVSAISPAAPVRLLTTKLAFGPSSLASESWRSEDGAKNDNGKKLFHGSSPG
jgi:hypothetical protein